MIQNMSLFVCPNCAHESHIFGSGGAERIAREMGLAFLGDIPLDAEICDLSDRGAPVVVSRPQGASAEQYRRIASKIVAGLFGEEQSN